MFAVVRNERVAHTAMRLKAHHATSLAHQTTSQPAGALFVQSAGYLHRCAAFALMWPLIFPLENHASKTQTKKA